MLVGFELCVVSSCFLGGMVSVIDAIKICKVAGCSMPVVPHDFDTQTVNIHESFMISCPR